MRKLTKTISSLLCIGLFLSISVSGNATTIDVLYQASNVTLLVGGYDQAPGSLAEPTVMQGELFGGGGTLGTQYEVLEWVNAAAPADPLNEWNYTGEVSGGTYDGALATGDTLLENGSNTADSLWLEINDTAWTSTTLPSHLVAFSMKADDNDGISNFYVDGVLVATIDLYHDEYAGYSIIRDDVADPDYMLGDYYLPLVILVDLRVYGDDERLVNPTTHTMKVDAIAQSATAPHYTDDAEIFGAAALHVSDPIVPEPATVSLMGLLAMALFRRRK